MKPLCQNFFITIYFLGFYEKKNWLILNLGMLFVTVFFSFLFLVILSLVTRVNGVITSQFYH